MLCYKFVVYIGISFDIIVAVCVGNMVNSLFFCFLVIHICITPRYLSITSFGDKKLRHNTPHTQFVFWFPNYVWNFFSHKRYIIISKVGICQFSITLYTPRSFKSNLI